MRLRDSLVVLAALLPLSFDAGDWSRLRPAAGRTAGLDGPTASYEPPSVQCVHTDGVPALAGRLDGGAVPVRTGRRPLDGVKLETVGRWTIRYSARLPGHVAVDETRVHRLRAATRGWMRVVGPATAGSLVNAGEVLAAYCAPGIATLVQELIHSAEACQKLKDALFDRRGDVRRRGELAAYERSVATTERTLRDMGMAVEQIERVRTTLEFEWLVEIRSPVRGLVLARNAANGQRFEPSTDLYTIADLSRVRILASASGHDAPRLRPGARGTVTHPDLGAVPVARVRSVRPGPHSGLGTVEVCLETDNPGLALRPEMTVNVELPVELGPALTVPSEALTDSGTRGVVYVIKEDGTFEPRRVVTGFRQGDRVEIVSGLAEGEKVVSSRYVLLDAESRTRVAESR